MTAVVVIDNHEDLDGIGRLTHPQIDDLIFSGSIPTGESVQVPFLSAANIFAEDNEFSQDVTVTGDIHLYGDFINHGEVSEIEVSTLSVESTVIFIGYGATASSIQGDRGLVFNVEGSNDPSFFWDKSADEFRLAGVDTSTINTGSAELNIFPDPSSQDFKALHIGSLFSEASIFASGSITAQSVNATAGVTAGIVSSLSGAFQEVTASNITSNVMSAQDLTVDNLTADAISSTSISADTLAIKDIFCPDGTSPFLVSGPGIDVSADPLTGQTTVSALMVGRFKFVGEIEELIDEGTPVVVPGLNMAEFEFDDQRWDIFVNGVLQVNGTSADYTVDQVDGITFNYDLEPDDVITVLILN
tara:strand:- start:720 stop:1796 length:1077 start_codon:yes stop_codon:yes gene_type:complete